VPTYCAICQGELLVDEKSNGDMIKFCPICNIDKEQSAREKEKSLCGYRFYSDSDNFSIIAETEKLNDK